MHVVPLVPIAVRILERTLTNYASQQGDFVFSGTDGRLPVSGWTKGHTRMMRAMTAVSGERDVVPWAPHDLRRTVATRIAGRLGVGGEQLIKRVLGDYRYRKGAGHVARADRWLMRLSGVCYHAIRKQHCSY